jgi:hypothetical protein
MPCLRVFQVGLIKLEHAPEGDGEAAGTAGKLGVRIITEDQIALALKRQEFLDSLLEPLGDWEIDGLNNVASVGMRHCLSADQQIADPLIEKIDKALVIFLIDIQLCQNPKEAFELRCSIDLHRSDLPFQPPNEPGPQPKQPVLLSGSEVHTTHATAGHCWSGLLLRHLGDHGLGGHEEAGD